MLANVVAILLGIALIIYVIGTVIRLIINARTNAQLKLLRERSNARAMVEDDLLIRLDEVRPAKHAQRRQDTNEIK